MMNKQWKIRKAVIDDAIGLQSCMQAAYSVYQQRMGDVRLPPMDIDYAEEIKGFPCWVAELNGDTAGGLIMMFEDQYASIANIAVHPQYQGYGIGKGLMMFAEQQCRTKGYSEMRLATHVLLKENVSLYLHLGWTEIERDDTRVYMQKKIAPA